VFRYYIYASAHIRIARTPKKRAKVLQIKRIDQIFSKENAKKKERGSS
jgi:hypothetical protein